LFEGDVEEGLLKENPDLRYATAPEKVKYLVRKGELEKAIATIPAQLRDKDLDLVISNFRATKKDYLVGKRERSK
jgi:hypothetical protein